MLEDWWRQRWGIKRVAEVCRVDLGEDGRHAIFLMRGVCVVCSCFFECEADVLAAAWDAWPVKQLVRDVFGALLAFCGVRCCHCEVLIDW